MSVVAVILLGVVLVAAMAFVVAAYTRRWAWTGFAGSPREEQPAKTLWDWLQLIGIPLTLAAVAFALNLAQSGRDQRHEDARAAAERRLADEQRREDAVNAYFRQISDLMLDRKLLTSQQGSEVQTIARTLTLAVLRRLDGRRKGSVLQFLNESGLIAEWHSGSDWLGRQIAAQAGIARGEAAKVNLYGADLRGVVVHTNLIGVAGAWANLDGADLRRADFRGAELANLSLGGLANLRGADFRGASVRFVDFGAASLQDADFDRAVIAGTDFTAACMTRARLTRTQLVGDRLDASGHDVDLSGATLKRTDLHRAWIVNFNLTQTRFINSRLPDSTQVQDPACVKSQ
jgi:uncharacterized protein YjbI with pentapeptide repeats